MRDKWVMTSFGEIADWSSGKYISKDLRLEKGPYSVLGANGEIGKTDQYLFDKELVVVGRVGSCGETYLSEGKVWISDNALIALPTAKVLVGFLYLLLKTFDYRQIISGTTQPLITQGKLKEQSVSLPPISEQKRIVDLVNSVDSYIEALQGQLERAKKSRAAVLYEVLTARGDGWTETTFGGLAQVTSGFAFSTNSWRHEGIPVIKINNVRDGTVSLDKCSFISEPVPAGASKFLLKKGDLLITLTGEIGAIGFVSQSQPMYLNQRVGLIKVRDPEIVSLEFLGLFLTLPQVRAEMWSHGKGNAQLNISPTSIHSLNVDLPPIPDQKRMVDLVSSMDEVVNAVEWTLQESRNLRSGLLSDLLSGEHEIPTSYDKVMDAR